MNDQDYLAITSQALNLMAKDFIKNTNSKDVWPVLTKYITFAILAFNNSSESKKEEMLKSVRESLEFVAKEVKSLKKEASKLQRRKKSKTEKKC